LLLQPCIQARRVGDEANPATAGAKLAERRHGVGNEAAAITDDTPDIAKQRVIGIGKLGKSRAFHERA